jgi:hypothetical protein
MGDVVVGAAWAGGSTLVEVEIPGMLVAPPRHVPIVPPRPFGRALSSRQISSIDFLFEAMGNQEN